MIMPTLQRENMRRREVKTLIQDHRTSERPNCDVDTCWSLAPEQMCQLTSVGCFLQYKRDLVLNMDSAQMLVKIISINPFFEWTTIIATTY